jgi:MFS family permease
VARVCYVLLLLNLADGMVSTLASAYVGSLGYPIADIGLIVALYSVASLASRLPSAKLADGKNAHRWLLTSCAVFAASLLLYPVATQTWSLTTVRVLHGLTFGAATTLNMATFLAVCTPANRRAATAGYTASWSGGYSIGNFVAGVIADTYGFGAAFIVAALFPLIAIALTPRHVEAVATIAPPKQDAKPTWRLLLHAEVRAVPLLAFSVNFLNALLTTLFPLYVLAIGQTLSVVGSARALQSLTNTLVRPISGSTVQRFGALQLGTAGVVLTAAAIVCIPFNTAPLILLGLFVVVGTGRAVGVVANATGTLDLASKGVLKRGTASALMTAGGDSGNVVAPLLAGATAAAIDLGPAMQVLAIATAIASIVAVLTSRSARVSPSSVSA